MKMKWFYFFALLLAFGPMNAQKEVNKNWGISARTSWLDYQSPLDGEFLNELDGDFSNMGRGAELSFFKGVKDWLDVTIPLRIGVANFPLDRTGSATPTRLYYGADALLKVHWPRKGNFLSPYLTGGIGGMMNEAERKADVQFPLGLGVDFRLGEGVYFNMESQMRNALTDYRDLFQHSLGIMLEFGGTPKELPPPDSDMDGIIDANDKCPNTAGLATLMGCPDRDNDGVADNDDACPDDAGTAAMRGCPDTDMDGIADDVDQCPKVKGVAQFKGCPDTDMDGVADADDKCPNEKGPASNAGCPITDRDGDGFNDDIDACPDVAGTVKGCPDTDGDMIADKDDKCPKVKGVAALMGCPDADADGIADIDDKCPNKAGTKANKGCPEIKAEDKKTLEFATQNIQFNTAKTSIKSESQAILNNIADILNRYPDYSVSIDGHTDSVGSAESNQRLSEGRAKACFDYLVRKGISPSRMSYTGYGETQPIADNMYKEGRQQNRRVEFNLFIR